ncbi:hypothetical protein [Bacterioplanoides pacificum]|uniref:Outer membrane protein beta-barrel domain-containing protein n=1 Tax=Bacterioplanoides pacificum TaxID=1171596 RepID=A0ABV7VXX2_9GAMM
MKTHSLSALVLIAVGHIAIANENENDADTNSYIPKPPAGAFVVTYFDSAAITNLNGVEPAPEATQVDTYLKVPLGVSGDLTQGLWVYQFTFREREFRFDNTPSSTKQRLYDIAFPLSYIVEHDKNSRWVFNLSPGVKSSLEYFGSDDLAMNAVAQYSSKGQYHGYNLGLVYTHRFGEGKFVPLMNYRYRSGKTVSMVVGFPFSRLSYAPSFGQHYFAKLTPEGGSWHVYNKGNKKQSYQFEQQGFRLGLGAEYQLTGPLWLGAEAGVQFKQQLTLDNDQGQSGTLELEDSNYLQLTAKLRFR